MNARRQYVHGNDGWIDSSCSQKIKSIQWYGTPFHVSGSIVPLFGFLERARNPATHYTVLLLLLTPINETNTDACTWIYCRPPLASDANSAATRSLSPSTCCDCTSGKARIMIRVIRRLNSISSWRRSSSRCAHFRTIRRLERKNHCHC
jgi:hypothetical protein